MWALDSINQLIYLCTGNRRTGNQSFSQIRQINELEKSREIVVDIGIFLWSRSLEGNELLDFLFICSLLFFNEKYIFAGDTPTQAATQTAPLFNVNRLVNYVNVTTVK